MSSERRAFLLYELLITGVIWWTVYAIMEFGVDLHLPFVPDALVVWGLIFAAEVIDRWDKPWRKDDDDHDDDDDGQRAYARSRR